MIFAATMLAAILLSISAIIAVATAMDAFFPKTWKQRIDTFSGDTWIRLDDLQKLRIMGSLSPDQFTRLFGFLAEKWVLLLFFSCFVALPAELLIEYAQPTGSWIALRDGALHIAAIFLAGLLGCVFMGLVLWALSAILDSLKRALFRWLSVVVAAAIFIPLWFVAALVVKLFEEPFNVLDNGIVGSAIWVIAMAVTYVGGLFALVSMLILAMVLLATTAKCLIFVLELLFRFIAGHQTSSLCALIALLGSIGAFLKLYEEYMR